jgi:hypothetical protein
MNENETADSVNAIRSDIEGTRVDLTETANELSDRSDPKKRLTAVTSDVTDSTKQVVVQAQEVSKDSAAKAQRVVKAGARRGQQVINGNEGRVIVAAVLLGVLIVGWHLLRGRR